MLSEIVNKSAEIYNIWLVYYDPITFSILIKKITVATHLIGLVNDYDTSKFEQVNNIDIFRKIKLTITT